MAKDDEVPVTRRARKIILPTFVLTEVCDSSIEGATLIVFESGPEKISYYERPRRTNSGSRNDGKPIWQSTQFNLFPVILDASGLPWFEANIYLLSRLENSINPAMSTYDGIADDLTAYRRFIDEEMLDWRAFPMQKLSRPTYRYSSHLRSAVASGAIKTSSAKRRMSSVIAFYAWVTNEGTLVPANAPWKESDVFFKMHDSHGLEFSKRVRTTDISIRLARQTDPFDGRIDDGGKLRPLPLEEQRWLVEALLEHRNTEMVLIHLIALLTGARIQTVLTIQVRHVRKFEIDYSDASSSHEIRCPVSCCLRRTGSADKVKLCAERRPILMQMSANFDANYAAKSARFRYKPRSFSISCRLRRSGGNDQISPPRKCKSGRQPVCLASFS